MLCIRARLQSGHKDWKNAGLLAPAGLRTVNLLRTATARSVPIRRCSPGLQYGGAGFQTREIARHINSRAKERSEVEGSAVQRSLLGDVFLAEQSWSSFGQYSQTLL